MSHATTSLALLLCLLAGTPLMAQTNAIVDGIPIGATVNLRTRDGVRLKAVLLSVDEAGIRVKPATRVPEPSRRIAFDRIERIEHDRDHVSFGKYAGVGGAIGAAVVLVLVLLSGV